MDSVSVIATVRRITRIAGRRRDVAVRRRPLGHRRRMIETALRHIPGGASPTDRPGMVTSKLGLPTGLAGLWLAIPTHNSRIGRLWEHGSALCPEVGVTE